MNYNDAIILQMTTDAKGPYPLNRNLSLDLQAGAIQAFIPSHEAGQPSGDRISGTLLSARFDEAPMGLSYIYPESSRSGSVAIDASERTTGVIFEATEAVTFEAQDVKPLAVLEKTSQGMVLYMRPTEDESRKIVMGKDDDGYFVVGKLFARMSDFASNKALASAFDAIQPISSYQVPISA